MGHVGEIPSILLLPCSSVCPFYRGYAGRNVFLWRGFLGWQGLSQLAGKHLDLDAVLASLVVTVDCSVPSVHVSLVV